MKKQLQKQSWSWSLTLVILAGSGWLGLNVGFAEESHAVSVHNAPIPDSIPVKGSKPGSPKAEWLQCHQSSDCTLFILDCNRTEAVSKASVKAYGQWAVRHYGQFDPQKCHTSPPMFEADCNRGHCRAIETFPGL